MSAAQARAKTTDWLRNQMVTQQFQVETEFGPRVIVLSAIVQAAREQTEANHPRRRDLEAASAFRRLLAVWFPALSGPAASRWCLPGRNSA